MLIAMVIFLLLVVIFAVQNAQMVAINFLTWSFSLNQALIVLGSAVIGLLIGALWMWVKNGSVRRLCKETSKALEESEKRIALLQKSLSEETARVKELQDELERKRESTAL